MSSNRHSGAGAWSLGLAVAVGAVFLALLPLARSFAVAEANEMTTGMDAPGAALLFALGGLGLILLALGLGVTGLRGLSPGRVRAFLGVLFSIASLVLIYNLGIAWEPPPQDLPPGFPTAD